MLNKRGYRLAAGMLAIVVAIGLTPFAQRASALTFNYTEGAGITALRSSNPTLANQVVSGFAQAGALWSSYLTDPITVNVTIDYTALGTGILGQTAASTTDVTYTAGRADLIADAKTADDLTATASLPNALGRTFYTNDRTGARVLDSWNSGTTTDNRNLHITTANAKAIGISESGSDGSITFSSNFTWAFQSDRVNGTIPAGAHDFIGTAAHEIAHLLGFISGVDTVDLYSGPNGPNKNVDLNGGTAGIGTLESYSIFSILDLYRYSANGTLDLSDSTASYFSINSGATDLGLFATGTYNGDGSQASHWKNGQNEGIMNPTQGTGTLAHISGLDLQALDVIGYDLLLTPEPATLALLAVGSLALLRRRRAAA